jgi:hypothetical protein
MAVIALIFADYMRAVTIILSALVLAALPMAIGVEGRPSRTWFLVGSIELVWFSGLVSLSYHFGEAARWYRTPVMLGASVLGVLYVASVLHQRAAGSRATLRRVPDRRG